MKADHRVLSSILLIGLIASISNISTGQEIRKIGIPELEKILKAPDDKLFVVNFWATWCAPCVKELPLFEKAAGNYDKSKVSFLLISLDFPSQVEKQLIPFLKKNKISLGVAVMTDLDYNSWIDKVDPTWQGNIPATLFFNNLKKQRHFHAGEVDEIQLEKMIKVFL